MVRFYNILLRDNRFKYFHSFLLNIFCKYSFVFFSVNHLSNGGQTFLIHSSSIGICIQIYSNRTFWTVLMCPISPPLPPPPQSPPPKKKPLPLCYCSCWLTLYRTLLGVQKRSKIIAHWKDPKKVPCDRIVEWKQHCFVKHICPLWKHSRYLGGFAGDIYV